MLDAIKKHLQNNSRNYSDYIIVGGLLAYTAYNEPKQGTYIAFNLITHLTTTALQRRNLISDKWKIAIDELFNYTPLWFSVSPENHSFSNSFKELSAGLYSSYLLWVYKGFRYANNLAIIGLTDKFTKNFLDWIINKPIKNEFEALAIYTRQLPSQILKYYIMDNFQRSPFTSFTALASNYATKTFLMEKIYKKFFISNNGALLFNFDEAKKEIQNQAKMLPTKEMKFCANQALEKIRKNISNGNYNNKEQVISAFINALELKTQRKNNNKKSLVDTNNILANFILDSVPLLETQLNKTSFYYKLESLFSIFNESVLGGTFGAIGYFITTNNCPTLINTFSNLNKGFFISTETIKHTATACSIAWPYAGNLARGVENYLKKNYFERIENAERYYAGIPDTHTSLKAQSKAR